MLRKTFAPVYACLDNINIIKGYLINFVFVPDACYYNNNTVQKQFVFFYIFVKNPNFIFNKKNSLIIKKNLCLN